MAEKFEEIAVVVDQNALGSGIYDLTLKTKNIAKAAKAGQFVSVYSNDRSKLLPRPISLCGIDRDEDTIRLVYRVTGENTGTEEFSKLVMGDRIRILGPLGNGFTVEPGKKAFLIGGGIGVPPMLQLAKDINSGVVQTTGAVDTNTQEKGQTEEKQINGHGKKICDMNIIMGYRDENTFLLDEFKEQADSFVATEDGSVGTKGNVIDAIKENGLEADVVYACGPMPMLRALKAYAMEHDMECYVSMEERMACGIGACLACVCKTKDKDAHSNVNNKRICKEGPVFNAKEVEL
ncbi:MAG: dihydroorotate dehydrogenase electron transfer subunit [Agathobacter sp.]|uniref:dihydroorotate dehydrogenase electron transfer subunit n=1 Tax=Agathobacter sp. TaxID=2021311 RepID=UPI003994D6C5